MAWIQATKPKHSKEYNLRSVAPGDLERLDELMACSQYVHRQLDWWSLNDWLDAPAFIVSASDQAINGMSLATHDGSSVAWWRALAFNADGRVRSFLESALQLSLERLRQAQVNALTCLAYTDWLKQAMPELGFNRLTRVVTLRKDKPACPHVSQADITIRPAGPADSPAILAVDRAAFDDTWHYGPRTMARLPLTMKHISVAECQQTILGYACGDAGKFNGHIVRLAVHPAYQGRQIGALLLADMTHTFFASGKQGVTLNTQENNAPAQQLYRRFGFRPSGEQITIWQRRVT